MKTSCLLFCLALLTPMLAHAGAPVTAQLTQDEITLANLINTYRQANGLPAIPISASLTKVAQIHTWDITTNHPDTGTDGSGQACSAHSWSNKGSWTPVCFTGADGTRMWSKPSELTSYTGNGFENGAIVGGGNVPQAALDGWKSDPPHNDVILNKNAWASMTWQAMGVGIYQGYAYVWFGTEVDPAGAPQTGELDPTPTVQADKYYRLKNLRLEASGQCLEGNQIAAGAPVNGATYMTACKQSDGQAWRFSSLGGGYYRMTTRLLDNANRCLEGNQYPAGYLGGAAFMDRCQSVSGQYWKLVAKGGHAYMQMTTLFREPMNECLNGNPVGSNYPLGGAAYMSKCDNSSTQLWELEAF